MLYFLLIPLLLFGTVREEYPSQPDELLFQSIVIDSTTGEVYGMKLYSDSITLYSRTDATSGNWAGYFIGNVHIEGKLTGDSLEGSSFSVDSVKYLTGDTLVIYEATNIQKVKLDRIEYADSTAKSVYSWDSDKLDGQDSTYYLDDTDVDSIVVSGDYLYIYENGLRDSANISTGADTDVDSVKYITGDTLVVYEDDKARKCKITRVEYADSTAKIDTTYTPFQTYVSNHSGADTDVDSIVWSNQKIYIYEDGLRDSTVVIKPDSASYALDFPFTVGWGLDWSDATDSAWVDTIDLDDRYVNESGDTITGNLNALASDAADSSVSNSPYILFTAKGDTATGASVTQVERSMKLRNVATWSADGAIPAYKLSIQRHDGTEVAYIDSAGNMDVIGKIDADSLGGQAPAYYITDSTDVNSWNYFNTEAELTALLDDNYEVQLNNEAGLYAVLSDVTDFVQTGELDYTDSSDVNGWNYFNTEAELTTLLDDNYEALGVDTSEVDGLATFVTNHDIDAYTKTEARGVIHDTADVVRGEIRDTSSLLNAGLTVDGTYSGTIASVTVDANTVGFGSALFLSADGHYDEADADSATTMPCMVLALETGTGTKKVLLQGYICKTSWNWTLGAGTANLIYVSTTTGTLTQTAPSATGDQVQIVGYAVSADAIYFNPNLMLIEIQ